jgi:hypothetical protein
LQLSGRYPFGLNEPCDLTGPRDTVSGFRQGALEVRRVIIACRGSTNFLTHPEDEFLGLRAEIEANINILIFNFKMFDEKIRMIAQNQG